MSQTFDVLIIGAGIIGCCTAYELAQRGLNVAIVEQETVGAGGTGKSSAIIRQHYSNQLTAQMALHSLRVFQNFDEQIGGECGFTPVGFVALVAAKDHTGLEANIALQRKVGIQTEMLSPETLQDFLPGLVTSDLVAAAYEPESGYADPYLTVNAFANAARRLGTKIFLHTKVTGVRFTGGKVVGVNTSKEPIEAPIIINSAGPWGARVAKMAHLDLPINACRIQVAAFRRPKGYEVPPPVVADFIHAYYSRPETGNLTLVGMIDPSEAAAIVDPDNFNEQIDTDFILEAGEPFVERYPPMERSQSAGGYASLYGITPDWHPIIDELPAGSGFFTASGFSGHGFKLGPAMGLMIADMVTKASSPLFSRQMFRFSRYAENDAVTGQYEYSIAG